MHIPGSKYVANRVLLIAALASGKSVISNVPRNRDIDLLLGLLRDTGIKVKELPSPCDFERTVEIHGLFSQSELPCNSTIRLTDAGESGTLLRFALGYACLLPGTTVLDAGSRNRERPILELAKALSELGAEIGFSSQEDVFPLSIEKSLAGGSTVLKGDISSQFISSMLIAAPYAQQDVEIKVLKPIVSSYYIDLTIREMREFGVDALRTRGTESDLFTVASGQRYIPRNMVIPKDWSSANYLLAAAVILGKEIRIGGISVLSNPGESEFLSILEGMGCVVSVEPSGVYVAPSSQLTGIEVDMKDSPDSVLTVLAIALFARGKTVISNIGHLIYKESNRIKQVEQELRKTGAGIETTDDSITIQGSEPLHGAFAETHNDHRLAMCLGLIQLMNPEMEIDDMGCVDKSFPRFWDYLELIQEGGEQCLEIQ